VGGVTRFGTAAWAKPAIYQRKRGVKKVARNSQESRIPSVSRPSRTLPHMADPLVYRSKKFEAIIAEDWRAATLPFTAWPHRLGSTS